MRASALTAIVVVGVLAGAASPSEAAPNGTAQWSNNELTGYCGNVDGGCVVAAQAMLKAWGTYTGGVDNIWVSGSNSALRAFQSQRGLAVDGCAGPDTWENLQALTLHHASGFVCGGTRGKYFQYTRSGRTANFLRPDTGNRYWQADSGPWGTGAVSDWAYYRFGSHLIPYC